MLFIANWSSGETSDRNYLLPPEQELLLYHVSYNRQHEYKWHVCGPHKWDGHNLLIIILSLEILCKWQNCWYEQPQPLSEKFTGFSMFYEKFMTNCVQTCVNKWGTFTVLERGKLTGIQLMCDFLQSITYYSDTTYSPRVKTSYQSTSPQNPSLTGNVVAIYIKQKHTIRQVDTWSLHTYPTSCLQ